MTARAPAAGGSSDVSTPYYVTPVPEPTRILVPAYQYPTLPDDMWGKLATAASSYPQLRITAIMNPNNGMFNEKNTDYENAVRNLIRNGGHAIGYISTRFKDQDDVWKLRTLDAILADVNAYQTHYQPFIEGYFVDQLAAVPLSLFQSIADHIKSIGLPIYANPGVIRDAAFGSISDVVVAMEDYAARFGSYDPLANGAGVWLYTRTNTANAMILHDTPSCATMQSIVATSRTPRYNIGVIYVTDDLQTTMGGPYDVLPTFWNSLLATVFAVNSGASLPSCN